MRARYWRSEPASTYRRSRLGRTACVRRHEPPYVEGSDFDEFRHELKQQREDMFENWFGRR